MVLAGLQAEKPRLKVTGQTLSMCGTKIESLASSPVVVQLLSCVHLFKVTHGLQYSRLLCPSLSPKFAQLMSIERVMPSSLLILRCPFLLLCSIFSQHHSLFPMSWLFASGGQSIGASASALILPMNIQSWFPLGLTALISLMSKGLSSVFFSTTVEKHQFFSAQPFLWSTSHMCTWLLEKP